jgi:hypothetical protein
LQRLDQKECDQRREELLHGRLGRRPTSREVSRQRGPDSVPVDWAVRAPCNFTKTGGTLNRTNSGGPPVSAPARVSRAPR